MVVLGRSWSYGNGAWLSVQRRIVRRLGGRSLRGRSCTAIPYTPLRFGSHATLHAARGVSGVLSRRGVGQCVACGLRE